MQKHLEIWEGQQEQWNPTSTAWIFFSFTRIFLYTFRKILYIFLMLCLYFPNNECKKISKFERKDKSNGIPLVQHDFFFLSREFSYIHSETFLIIFLCYVRISRIMNAKKSRNLRGRTRAMEFHLYSMEFFSFFHEYFPIYIQKRSLQFFYYAVFVFPE